MSSRLPPVPRDQLSAHQQQAYDELTSISDSSFGAKFTFKRKDGAFVGPYPAFLAAPDMGLQYMRYVAGLNQASPLSAEVREVVILATGSHYKAEYELYAHRNVAISSTRLSEQQVGQICKGEKPSGLDEACDVAFDAARYLAGRPGPLPQELWDRAGKALGKEGTVAMVHFIGLYAYTCIVLNAMDAPVPKEGE